MLFAVGADSFDYETVDAEVAMDLDFRAELFDEWMLALTRGVPARSAVGAPPPPFASERPGAHPNVPPPR